MALADKIRQIDELKKQLNELTPMPAEQQQKLDEKLRLEFHYNTNHIEGNTLTYGETKLAILFDQVSEGHSLREYEEMKASDVAYKYVQGLAKEAERPLTESFIKELNQILLVREFYKDAITESGEPTRRLISVGEYKKHPNSVRLQNGEMFHYASPTETPAKMTDMLAWYREEEEKKEHHPLILAALLHYRFVVIHPFDDGNGRVSRLLMNYVLFKYGFPLVVIKSDDKANYLRALNRADVGEELAFVEYIADQLIWSLELSIKAAKGEDIEEQEDWKKKLALLDRELSVNKKAVMAKSTSSIDLIVSNSLELISGLWDKLLLSFGEYFFSIEVYYLRSEHGYLPLDKNKIDDKSIVLNGEKSQYFQGINFRFQFKHFRKNGLNSFNIPIGLIIKFEDVGYAFLLEQKEIGDSLYAEKINSEDILLVFNAMAQLLVGKIEEAVKQR